MPRVSEINVYPVKGCRPIAVQEAAITPTGFALDRTFMIVRASDNKFVTQRQEPRIAFIGVDAPLEALLLQPLPPGASLTLSAPDMPALKVPLQREASEKLPIVETEVWEWKGLGQDQGDDAAAWLTQYLGKPHRLLRYVGKAGGKGAGADPTRRPTDADFAPHNEVGFADGFPFLLIARESLEDLNKHIPDMPMKRFRPNIVTEGSDPWAEDAWEALQIGGGARKTLEFAGVKPCSRCKVTTINPDTAEVGDEPLKGMRAFRSGKVLGWAANHKSWTHDVFIGINLVARQEAGRVAVGDELTVLRVRSDGFAPAARKLAVGDPGAAQRLVSLFWVLLGPLVGALVFWIVSSR